MGIFNVFNIAGSGMSAQSVRLNTVASNMANANNVSGDPAKIYRAKNPVFSAVMQGLGGRNQVTGVRVDRIQQSANEAVRRYEPDNPQADDKGYVYQADVNPVEEMANMISASRSYQNNVEVLNTAKQLMLSTLRLGE
ncbi:MAG TPA: flagellar basal body rod protein FlgC [Gammaproteobacteria bacterium]|nr:flagellar basal body rod protein FlgC [Gammaproteobacteria bacterium]